MVDLVESLLGKLLCLLPLICLAGCPMMLVSEDPVVFERETNSPPVADAGMHTTVNAGDVVILMGTGSSDPDGNQLSFWWIQTEGEEVEILAPFASITAFQSPKSPGTLEFILIVSDGHVAVTDDISIEVAE